MYLTRDRYLSYLPAIEENLPPIILRAHREVYPIRRTPLLLDEFIEIAMGTIRDVEQDASHADHLLRAIALNIDGTTSEMIRTLCPTAKAIDFLRAITRGNNNRNIAILIAAKIQKRYELLGHRFRNIEKKHLYAAVRQRGGAALSVCIWRGGRHIYLF